MLDPHTSGKLRSHCMSPWERHCFKDGSYDRYQRTTVVAPWPAAIAPKFLRPLVRPGSSPLASLRFPPAHVPTPEGWKAELALTDLTPQSFDWSAKPATSMHGMYVCTPQLAGGNPLVGPNSFKTLGEGPRLVPPKREFPLLIVPTPKGWKAEYTLASRMQIHESLTVLALLTRGEARTSDPWICSLMLYHLSYLTTTYIHTYIHTYMHTYIHK